MSDNPHAATAHEFRLPGHAVLAITGRDAVPFAQAQFMNDVAALAEGQWQWNGWLTAKGRAIALFALLKFDAERLWLVLPDLPARELAARLQGFVFRSKAVLTSMDLLCAGSFDPPSAAAGARFATLGDGDVELDMGGEGGPRRLRVGRDPAQDDAVAAIRWEAADLAHGLPRLRGEQVEAWTPQQLSLERLRAYSLKKGCYPGQEIVARTHFLGQAKRGLVRLRGAGVGAPGEVRTSDPGGEPRAIGRLVCAAGDEALAVMPTEAGDGPFEAGNRPCTRLPLLDGLAR